MNCSGHWQNDMMQGEGELKEADEIVREDMWLEEIYVKQSRVPNEVWLKAVCGKSSWIFDCEKLRISRTLLTTTRPGVQFLEAKHRN